MSRRARALAAATATLAVLTGLAGCDTNAKGTYFVDRLRPSLAEQLGAVSSIRCPETIRIQNETVFPCDVELASGRRHTIEVTYGKDSGLRWKTI